MSGLTPFSALPPMHPNLDLAPRATQSIVQRAPEFQTPLIAGEAITPTTFVSGPLGALSVYGTQPGVGRTSWVDLPNKNGVVGVERAVLVAPKIESKGFALTAPSFNAQVEERSRDNVVTYTPNTAMPENKEVTSEFQALQELHAFLSLFLSESKLPGGSYKDPVMAEQAQSMLNNLNFIGDSEYKEATAGLAQSWKNYLDADPARQLCLVAGISDSPKYPGQRKSDDYLLDTALSTFSNQDLVRYSGRIVNKVADLTAAPRDARVVLVDDWSISGSQIRREYGELATDPKFSAYDKAGSVEVNLLVSGPDRLQNGIAMNVSSTDPHPLKVRSYYQGRPAEVSGDFGESHISGAHSSVNYGFERPINKGMIRTLIGLRKLKKGELPIALTKVVRPYRTLPRTVEFTSAGLQRTELGSQT